MSTRGDDESRGRRVFRLGESGGSGSHRQAELDEELRVHLEMRTEELVSRGWDPDEARAEAERRFGAIEEAREDLRRSARRRDRRLRGWALLDSLRTDVRLAFRRLRLAPGYASVALLTMALGIGLNTSMFAAVDQVLLRPLPFAQPDRLVTLMSVTEQGNAFPWVSSANWLDWERENRTLTGSAIFNTRTRPLVEIGREVYRPSGAVVSPAFFEVLRPPVADGRTFTAEDVLEARRLLVVSEDFWRNRMGSPELPASLRLAETGWTVVGTVPREGAYPAGVEVWIPRAVDPATTGSRDNINWESIGRLRAGVSVAQASADLDGIAAGIRERAPEARYSWGVGVEPLESFWVRDARERLLLLAGAVGAVLLIVCLNLAGLSVARTVRRSRETAVRTALGAGRLRVLRESLTEHVVVALLGAIFGLGVAWGGIALLQDRASELLPRGAGIVLDERALGFALAVAVLAGLASGLIPALRAARIGAGRVATGARGGVDSGLGRTGGLLVVGEVAVALTLLVGGSLLIRSFQTLTAREIGFDPEGVVVGEILLDRSEYGYRFGGDTEQPGAEARRDFWRGLVDRLERVPEVRAVGLANALPTYDGGTGFIEVEGLDDPDAGAAYRAVSGRYFEALEISLLAGRTFDERDGPGTGRIAVVNHTMADRYWPDGSPLGQRIRAVSMESLGSDAPWLEIVGVVEDVREAGYDLEVRSQMYVLAEQVPFWMGAMQVAVDAGDRVPGGLPGTIRGAVRDIDPSVPVSVSFLESRVGDWVSERLFLTTLITGFGAMAVLLAGIGIYGLLAFIVAARTREIGIRSALGARRSEIVGSVLRRSLGLAAVGVLPGLLGAWWTAGALRSLLVEVGATDLRSWASAVALLLAAAVAAALVPALRASRIAPVEALRAE